MKSNSIKLAEWQGAGEDIDIDWPKVQKLIGIDHLEWLLLQSQDQCQLLVEKSGDTLALVAEFYNDKVQVDYWLRWAR